MKTFAVPSIGALVLLLTACGSESPVPVSTNSPRTHSYSEATVDSFISRCLSWSGASVGQCACILDEHRKTVSETAFLASLSAAQSPSRAAIFRGCGLADLASVMPATSVAAAESESAGALAPPVGAAPSGVSPPTTAPTTVRAATDTEACVQQKLLEAQAAAGGGSVSLKKLDSIRAECS